MPTRQKGGTKVMRRLYAVRLPDDLMADVRRAITEGRIHGEAVNLTAAVREGLTLWLRGRKRHSREG